MKSAARQLVRGWSTSIRDAAHAWRDFWFAPADPYTLGIIRLLTGWMLVYNLLVWGIDLHAFFGVNGLQPLQAIMDFHAGTPVFSLWFYVSEPWIPTVHWCCVAIAFLFFLGMGTRVTSVLAYLITISYSQRVPVANFGLDQILGMLCLYLAIGPSGACLSLDRWWKRRRARNRGIELLEPHYSSARTAVRLIQIHMCVIYFWAGIAKLKGDTWFTGEAMWQVLANEEYQTMDLTWLAWIPFIPYLVAHVTVIWEMSFCVLIWNKKFRPWMLLIGTGMHFGIGAFLGMWTFGLVMTYAYFAFSDPAAWRRRIGWFMNRKTAETTPAPKSEEHRSLRHAFNVAEPSTADASTEPQRPFPDEQPAETPSRIAVEATDLSASPTAPVEATVDFGQAKVPPTMPQSVREPEPQELSTTEIQPSKINAPLIPNAASHAYNADDNGHQDTAVMGDMQLNPETALLLISLCKNERKTLRSYFRKHDIVCKAATTAENGLSLAATIKPVAILVAGTQMHSEELSTLLEDLEDISDAPTLTLTSELQASRLSVLGLATNNLNYPVTPGEIRRTLGQILFGDNSEAPASVNEKRNGR